MLDAPSWLALVIGNGHGALGVGVERDGDGDAAALVHGVGRLLEVGGHGRHVVVGDGDGRLFRRTLAHIRGQGPEAQLHVLLSSLSLSAAAAKVISASVSPLLKVTLAGTPE